MKETFIIFPALNLDPLLYFFGTDAEIEDAELKEAARADELKEIFFDQNFYAAEWTRQSGAREILHHSTRPGVLFQLSYIAADGVPSMHENYINLFNGPRAAYIGTASELARHFTLLDEELKIRVIYK